MRVNVALETPPHALNEAIAATAAAAVPNIRASNQPSSYLQAFYRAQHDRATMPPT